MASKPTTATDRQVPAEVVKAIAEYRRLQRFWFLVHYFCGLAGITAGVLAAYRETTWWLWGVLAAVSTALVTFLGPLQKGAVYKRAYYLLARAQLRFAQVPKFSVEALLTQYDIAQQIVLTGDSEPPGVQQGQSVPTP